MISIEYGNQETKEGSYQRVAGEGVSEIPYFEQNEVVLLTRIA